MRRPRHPSPELVAIVNKQRRGQPLSNREVAVLLGISKSLVNRIELRALRKMRTALEQA